MKVALATILIAACTPPLTPPPNAPKPGTLSSVELVPIARPIGTAVLSVEPSVATPVLNGPFLMTSVNPGTRLEFAIVPSQADGTRANCSGEQLWFEYTGGGLGVGTGQTLCVLSGANGAAVQAFSGYDPTYAPPAQAAP